jgi:long-chain fatty acid transport protein
MKSRSALMSKLTVLSGVALFTLLMAGTAFGAGFMLLEQSVPELGSAFSGGAARAEDATTVYYNPAGMLLLEGTQSSLGIHIIRTTSEFKDTGSTHVLGGALQGGPSGDAGSTALVPNLYLTKRLSDKTAFGFGLNVPFGLSTEYPRNWIGRYHAVYSSINTINMNPSVAYRVNDRLSIGAGLSVQHMEAEISKAIDMGTLNALPVPLGGFGGAIPGLLPQGSDSFIELEADSWAYGYNLGLMYDLSEEARMGVSYRSEIKHDAEGRADFSSVPALVPTITGGYFTDTDITSTITLPALASVSVHYDLSPQWSVMGDISWTGWSSFDELRVKFASGQPDNVIDESWEDTMRYAVGASYESSEKWKFRGGLAYDETPIPDAEHLTPSLPGGNRTVIGLGSGYRHSDSWNLDIGYAHFIIEEPKINKDPSGNDVLAGGLKGTYDASADILSFQANYKF